MYIYYKCNIHIYNANFGQSIFFLKRGSSTDLEKDNRIANPGLIN